MIIVDTNVISEFTKQPSPAVQWLLRQEPDTLRIAATSLTEVIYGLHRMPGGRRRDHIVQLWESVEATWTTRILAITPEVAHVAGRIMAARESRGRRIHLGDAQIAGTALVHGAAIATRNVKDFDGLGIELINPWE